MSTSRRPELEKDNPTAPQIYVGPRRKRALARMAAAVPAQASTGIEAALEALVDAAEQFAHSLPPTQETDRERHALMEAISQAQTFLSLDSTPSDPARPAAKPR
ncbi:MAG: hypothetical protein H8K06_16215 [Nitrospira sp.]|uniref:Uncharacterized protein n=1 Tax=Nitrospira defluvii TaxID=330214 RepID=A0ABM8S3T8_9BACT|nr:hypothetical protein [Nitrospira defluvii]MCS6328611.1 hypothetical protein [Nitrospira sp.]CAE6787628.1 conserved hypothetical protein [Nitrospira defluvii]